MVLLAAIAVMSAVTLAIVVRAENLPRDLICITGPTVGGPFSPSQHGTPA